ncbi:MAG: N-acetylmuramoyl-L-alanine amidase [Desulfotomaculaceae bacterium]|nr:N-acetylmuramoyl-L-alanine amidase [Desulfotomaculaceae bacterium]
MKVKTQFGLLPVLVGLALLMGAVLSGANPAGAAGTTAVVAGSAVNVRNGPGTNYGVIAQANLGDQLTVLGQSTDWYNVGLNSGGQGWVAGWLVNIQQPQAAAASAGQVALLNGNGINVRGGPGTSYGIITQGGSGDRFPVLESSGDWVKVQLSSGTGWVAGWLVSLETAQPVVSQPEAVNPAPAAVSGGAKVAVVNGSIVNVRSGPGTSNAVVGSVVQGNSLPVLSQSGDWCQVSLPSGGNGWVAGWLVALNDVAPVPAAPTPVEQTGNPGVSRGGDRPDNNDNNDDSDDSDDSESGKVLSMNVQKTASDQTAFAVKTDTPVSYNSFYLSNPNRLVVDIEGVSPGALPETKNVSSKTVSKVRAGHYQKNPDVTRLVFELKSGVMCEVSLSSNKKTLNIDTYIPNLDGAYKNRIIVLDPGHGGSDPGAIGPNGTQEKTVTLDIAKRVSKLLEAQGAKVIMTRSMDKDVSLSAITDIANKNKADILVSIHINANTNPSIGGTTSYIYDGTETPRLQESNKLACSIQNEMIKSLGLRDIGVKEANFAVVRTSNMPAVLLELAFISNSSEEKLLKTDSFKNKAAEAIVKGIGTYFAQKRTA